MAASGARPIKVGLFLPTLDGTMPDGMPGWSDLKSMAQRAEAIGFDSLWLPDHRIFKDARSKGERIALWEWSQSPITGYGSGENYDYCDVAQSGNPAGTVVPRN
jgi:hypothetical protein